MPIKPKEFKDKDPRDLLKIRTINSEYSGYKYVMSSSTFTSKAIAFGIVGVNNGLITNTFNGSDPWVAVQFRRKSVSRVILYNPATRKYYDVDTPSTGGPMMLRELSERISGYNIIEKKNTVMYSIDEQVIHVATMEYLMGVAGN